QVIYQNIVRIREDKNMTLSVLQYSQQSFNIVGQHESVIICRNDGSIEEIDTMDLGFPIGLVDDIADFITTDQFQLATGETVLLYTDGITEAENTAQEQYGVERMTNMLRQHHQADATTIRNSIIEDVYTFIDSAEVFDDISMMVIKQR
ncbi:MAG: SpoIIE family protein phosphatase, partial [Sphaerospermopsis sp. SIO1G2]|nr:SpoIIE family protein phosphatase [Sphaerospermopsis sp. SIO1G2]